MSRPLPGDETSRPRLLQVLYGGLGGHGSVAFSLIQGDQDNEMSHSLLFFGIEEARKQYADECQELGIPWASVVKKTGTDFRAWREVWSFFQKHRPDCLLVHSMTLAPVALSYQWYSGCKVIFVDHQTNSAKSAKEWVATTVASLFGRQLVLLTEAYEAEVRSKLGPLLREERTRVINNGIDVNRYSPLPARSGRETLTISMQARFSDTKDQASLIRAFARVCKLRPDLRLRLVLAGDGALWQENRNLVESLKLSNRVEMPGMLGEAALIDLLRSTDIYVHSSIGETMSTAVMQAMSTGLAVVGTDISGINNMVEQGHTGTLFRPGDVAQLSEILLDWLDHPDAVQAMALRAREVALERFSSVEMFKRYAALCREP